MITGYTEYIFVFMAGSPRGTQCWSLHDFWFITCYDFPTFSLKRVSVVLLVINKKYFRVGFNDEFVNLLRMPDHPKGPTALSGSHSFFAAAKPN